MTRVVTGQLDAYVEPGPRLVDEVPGHGAEFERVGGGAVLNNSPYDLAAAALCLRGGRRGGHRRPRASRWTTARCSAPGAEFQMSVVAAPTARCTTRSSPSWTRV